MKSAADIAAETGNRLDRVQNVIRSLGIKEDKKVGNCRVFNQRKALRVKEKMRDIDERKGNVSSCTVGRSERPAD